MRIFNLVFRASYYFRCRNRGKITTSIDIKMVRKLERRLETFKDVKRSCFFSLLGQKLTKQYNIFQKEWAIG